MHLVVWLQGPAPVDDAPSPYALATVELAEQSGLRISTLLTECPKERMHPGLEVRLAWAQRAGTPYPVFVPAGSDGSSS